MILCSLQILRLYWVLNVIFKITVIMVSSIVGEQGGRSGFNLFYDPHVTFKIHSHPSETVLTPYADYALATF